MTKTSLRRMHVQRCSARVEAAQVQTSRLNRKAEARRGVIGMKSSFIERFSLVLALAVLSSCRATQLTEAQSDLRTTVLALYEDQLMDNLIRAKMHLPVVHLDYSNITAKLSQTVSAESPLTVTSVQNSFDRTPDGATAPLNATVQTKNVLTRTVVPKVSGSQVTDLTLTAQPVIDADLYERYASFAAGNCVMSGTATQAQGKLLQHESNKLHYWIDSTGACPEQVFELFLATTVGRQTRAPASIQAKIAAVIDGCSASSMVVRIDTMVPDRSCGQLTAYVGGTERKLSFLDSVNQHGRSSDNHLGRFVGMIDAV